MGKRRREERRAEKDEKRKKKKDVDTAIDSVSSGGGGNCVISVPGIATLAVAAGSNLTTQSQSLQSSALQT